jgi:PKD repeat protein
VFVDLHSYGQLVLWPWGFTSLAAPNGTSLQTLGRKLAFLNGYQPRQASGLYPTEGTTDEFAYGELGVAAYTVELGTTFFQPCSAFESEILPGGLSALVYAAKVARTPYLTPAGPDTLAVTVLPVSAVPGQAVRLRAEINDARYSGANGSEPVQAIAGAEYYVDLPPWMATAAADAHAMAAEDGVLDDPIEQVQALVDTAGLAPGRHTVFVRGQDALGNWGAWSAAFMYLLDPAASPRIEGYVRQASTRIPLEATVSAGPFQASTDPATGHYVMSVISGTYDLAVDAPAHLSSGVGGVAAYDHALIRQDFDLDPRCNVFADDVESGNAGWTAGAPWAISAESSHSTSHAWTDSPGSSYGNGLGLSLTSPVLDLSGVRQVALQFWHTYDLEMNRDYAYVDYSITGGASWATAASYTGSDRTAWALEQVPLAALDGQPNARLRFRITSDSWGTADGWHVDDIALSGGGLVCLPPMPTAAFVTSSPDWLGQATTFANITAGTGPITYTWDLGDGTPAVTQVHPTHTYGAAGLYTVVLTATDASGAAGTARRTVAVYGVPAAAFVASSPSWVGATTRVTNTTLGSPPGDPGIAYQWDWGDGGPGSEAMHSSHVYAGPGSYRVVLTATNPAGYAVASAAITAHVAGVTVYPLHSDRDGSPGTAVTHTVHITNTGTATDTFSLSLAGNRWATTVPAHTSPLAPGAATALDLIVGVPTDADLDASDVVTVTISSSDRHTVASSILATRVIAHRLFLPWLRRGS